MAGPACLIPGQSVRLYNLAVEKKWDAAMSLQRKLWQINLIFSKYNLAACIKAGLTLQGFDVGHPLPPQETISGKALEDIRNALIGVDAL